MTRPIVLLATLALVVLSASGKPHTNNGDKSVFPTNSVIVETKSRGLKGVLKYYNKEQSSSPRVTDSDSLEFDEVVPSPPAPVIPKKKSNKKKKPSVFSLNRKRPSTETKSEDDPENTTIFPSVITVDTVAAALSKSDLYGDDLDDIDDCAEGDVMKVSCNTCVCSEGKYFCSKKECVNEKHAPAPPPEKASSKRKGGVIKYHSVKGTSGSSSSIKASYGDITEEPALLTNLTYPIEKAADNSQCIDGRTKPVDCNQCICALGTWACTKMSCIALTLREKASYSGDAFLKSVGTLKEVTDIDDDCMEGEAKPIGCNQCVCHKNAWQCSDFSCPSTIAPPKIIAAEESCQTEEDVKSKDCNICSCRRGLWVCTKNDCKKFGNRYFNPVSHQRHGSNESDQQE